MHPDICSRLGQLSFPAWPQFDDSEAQALQRALQQGQWWRGAGSEVSAFEEEFATFHGAPAALAVTNGTHALELALRCEDICPGDEVIVPAFTFISTSMAVQNVGAVPVPVDVDLTTYNLDLNCVKAAISSKTRAVIPVHMAGHLVDLDALEQITTPREIRIIQDAAHAHGAEWKRRRAGQFSSIACFSFQNFKLMTAGEGGALTFPSHELREKAFLLHNCGRSPADRTYAHDVVGSNYRMSEFSAAVLRCQLRRLEDQNSLREEHSALLTDGLMRIPGLIPQGRDPRCNIHSRYMYMFRLDPAVLPGIERNRLVTALVEAGIPAFVNYRPLYRTRAFWNAPALRADPETLALRCPNAETIALHGVWIHHRVLLGSAAHVEHIIRTVEAVVTQLADVRGIS